MAPARRGQGIASQAVRVLLVALRDRGVTVVIAKTAFDNPASARVLQKVGFARVGQRLDPEDGALDLWQVDLATFSFEPKGGTGLI